MKQISPRALVIKSRLGLILALILVLFLSANLPSAAAQTPPPGGPAQPGVQGPFVGVTGPASVFSSNLRAMPLLLGPQPLKKTEEEDYYAPGEEPKGLSDSIVKWVDPVAQTTQGGGLSMPSPSASFDGMSLGTNGSGIPPDPNGDVGPNYYIQAVNTAVAIYSKTTHAQVTWFTFNILFQNASPATLCNTNNDGDSVAVYDRFADRWLLSDFAFSSSSTSYYECIAISRTSDPVNGGWYLYAVKIATNVLNDYPKVGVWSDGYYFTFNLFGQPGNTWNGVQVWGFNKAKMLTGDATNYVSFALAPQTGYASLLPAHAISQPPSGAPEYLASVSSPNQLLLWKLQANWTTPSSSTLTGPADFSVASFASAASIPQFGSSALVDSLSYRPMMQLIYRNEGGVEAIWMNHTVASHGVAGLRWYELRNPGSATSIYQQGTYQPDTLNRWMGSLAVDVDGNMAIGYSVSSADMYPAIRYIGRQAGEILGLLPQTESVLIQGNGSESGYTRWGDYSAMSLDPDGCTFWYTTQYYQATGAYWNTRIGAFKYPSCGQPKGTLQGVVRNSANSQPIPNVQVTGKSNSQSKTVITDATGSFSMSMMAGSYNLTAGPLTPAYPISTTVNAVGVTAGNTTTQNMTLNPVPSLAEGASSIDDHVPGANGNGYPEPKESGIKLWNSLQNAGAMTSSSIVASLSSSTPGVTISVTQTTYPNIPSGQTVNSVTPFVFSLSSQVACGTDVQFQELVTDSLKTYTENFSLNASIPLARTNIFSNTVEAGTVGWTTVGVQNTWAITTLNAHSPTHSWTDSPSGNYVDNTNSWVRTPAFNLSNLRHAQVSAWVDYSLEPGYDFVYLDYSLDGGATWSTDAQALETLNGLSGGWTHIVADASVLDNHANVALRFRLVSDQGVTYDGIYIDDIGLSYQPYTCLYGVAPVQFLPFINH